MKDSFSSRQWWRLPPVIVISLIAAVALLFLSGRAAVMAFAEGEDDITISFHANGASGSPPASITVEKGETFTLPSDSGGMTKEGYSLVRWSVTPDGSTNTWSLGSQEWFYEDTVLYALWEKNVTVTFDLNGGTGSAPEPLIIRPTDFGSYATALPLRPTRRSMPSGQTAREALFRPPAQGKAAFLSSSPASPRCSR